MALSPAWTALTLTLLVAVGISFATVDVNALAGIVQRTCKRFRPYYRSQTMKHPMFSVAVSIPFNKAKNIYDINQVPDDGQTVRDTMIRCEVYGSQKVVAATVLRWPNVLDQCPNEPVQWPDVLEKCGLRTGTTWSELKKHCPNGVSDRRADHAEYRTLQHFNSLLTNLNKDDLLLFYVRASPCDRRCSNDQNPWNILDSIKNITMWNNYAVVFSNIFQPRSGHVIPEKNLKDALVRLGGSIGLGNIFRCTGQPMQCTSCKNNNAVTRFCYSDQVNTCQSTPFIKPR